MNEIIGKDALEEMEGKTIDTMEFDLGSISIIFEDGSDVMLYDQSGIGIRPILHNKE